MITRIILFLLFTSTISFAQQAVSTLRGTVYDTDSNKPLVGASIKILHTEKGTVTDSVGSYRFSQLPTGRYNLLVSFVGYKTVLIPEILLESGKEQVIPVALTYSDNALGEAVVYLKRSENLNGVSEITTEQTLRYASTYLDPARVATSLPGVAAADDQANGLSVRGHSPNQNTWRLEGVDIVNPNHLSNAGTVGDRATQTGGGVNILSTQVLGTTNFLTGAYAATYGNALGGIMDMSFRNGNNERREHIAQISLIGIDLATEGPFSKNSKASYLANYRYSFTGLLGAMGVKFGGEAITFQDLSFNLNLPTKKAGDFKLFGLAGTSKNEFKGKEDQNTWEDEKDSKNITFQNKMGAIGLAHNIGIGKHSNWASTLAISSLEAERSSIQPLLAVQSLEYDKVNKTKIAFTTALNHRFNAKHRIKIGTYLNHDADAITVNTASGKMDAITFQPYGTWQWTVAKKIRTEIGLHYLYFNYNKKSSLEPRAALRWDWSPKSTFHLSYGHHSRTQAPQVYMSVGSKVSNNNHLLGLTKAKHYSTGYEHRFKQDAHLKVEAYYQELSNVPIGQSSGSTFSVLNLVENNVNTALTNKGLGRNMGVEVSFNKYLTNDFYLMVAGSVYQSEYKVNNHWRSTRFNGNHTFSLTTGKEFTSSKGTTWGVNTKILWLGGFRDTPINEGSSQNAGTTVYYDVSAFTIKMKDYFRPDLRVYRKKSHDKYSTTLAIDIQNVSNTNNQAYSYFDALQGKVVQRSQMGMVPVLSYRWEF